MPVKVYEENECVKNHARELSALGNKPLIISGKSSAKANGSLDDVISALESQGKTYAYFNEVEENPSIETIMKAKEIGLRENCDYTIGIGGGSPMDAAKAIALMMANPEKGADFLDEKLSGAKCLPVVAIPTTCGTGSEVTGVSVLTRHAKKSKGSIPHKIYPAIALLDRKYLMKAPKNVINNTAVDALAHMIESYLNSNATDFSKMFVKEGMLYWRDCQKVLSGEEKLTEETAQKLLLASNYAGMAIAHTATSLPHGLSYYLTYDLGIPHGKACAYFLAGYLKEAPEKDQEIILEMSGFSNIEEFDNYITKVCELTPIPQDLLEKAATGIGSNEAKLKNCPFPVDMEAIKRIAGVK